MTLTIDGQEVQDITIDGDPVDEVTIDGQTVWKAVTIVDSFEDQNLNEYTDHGTNDLDHFSFDTDAKHGNYSLKFDGGSDFGAGIYSYNGLPYYPQRGDEIEYFFYTPSNPQDGQFYDKFLWALDSNFDTGYELEISYYEGGNHIFELTAYTDNGGNDLVGTTSININKGQWYKAQIDFYNTITVRLLDLNDNLLNEQSANHSESGYDSGGIGIGKYDSDAFADTSANGGHKIDGIRVLN